MVKSLPRDKCSAACCHQARARGPLSTVKLSGKTASNSCGNSGGAALVRVGEFASFTQKKFVLFQSTPHSNHCWPDESQPKRWTGNESSNSLAKTQPVIC